MKKLLSILLAAVMIFSMFSATSVVTQAKDNTPSTATLAGFATSITEFFETWFQSIDDFFAELFGAGKNLPDVSEWTDEQIIEYYKEAAARTHDTAVTKESSVLKYAEMGDDDYSNLFETVLLNSWDNSTYVAEGINGNYEKLEAADCNSIDAYKKGRYIVVELSFNDHSDSFKEDVFRNPISHGISIVEDKNEVLDAMGEDFTLDLSEGDIVLKYTNAKITVRIDGDGYIRKGTWKYDMALIIENVSLLFDEMEIPMKHSEAGFTQIAKVGSMF